MSKTFQVSKYVDFASGVSRVSREYMELSHFWDRIVYPFQQIALP